MGDEIEGFRPFSLSFCEDVFDVLDMSVRAQVYEDDSKENKCDQKVLMD